VAFQPGKRVTIRLGVMMTLDSWNEEIVNQLLNHVDELHVIVFEETSASGYLNLIKGYSSAVKERLLPKIAGLHYLKTFGNGYLKYVTCIPALKALVKRQSLQGLVLLYGGGFASAAYLSGFRPYFLYAVGSDVLLARGVRRLINRVTYRAAAEIFANGRYLGQMTGVLTGRKDIRPLYIGIDPDHFMPRSHGREQIPKIICTRGFNSITNNGYLIDALSVLGSCDLYDEVVFTSAGPDLHQIQAMAQRTLPFAIQQRIKFLGGVTSSVLLENLQSATIYVSLSRSDGTSISLLEALSCGLFPILSDIPSNREWIFPEERNGLLVPLDDPKALASALYRAMTDKEMLDHASLFNRQRILERGNIRKNIAELSLILKRRIPTEEDK
jgi:glycosyltransferase involved in cell wall biosynthesis